MSRVFDSCFLIRKLHIPQILLVSLLLVCLSSCESEPSVVRYRVPKSKPSASISSVASNFIWQKPSSWHEQPASSMRLASFSVPFADGQLADVSLVRLDGQAGGIVANVNRWRAQINLPPQTDKEVSELVQQFEAGIGQFSYFKIVNPSTGTNAILASIFEKDDFVLFVKLVAPFDSSDSSSDSIVSLESSFLNFCRSIEFAEDVAMDKQH